MRGGGAVRDAARDALCGNSVVRVGRLSYSAIGVPAQVDRDAVKLISLSPHDLYELEICCIRTYAV